MKEFDKKQGKEEGKKNRRKGINVEKGKGRRGEEVKKEEKKERKKNEGKIIRNAKLTKSRLQPTNFSLRDLCFNQ